MNNAVAFNSSSVHAAQALQQQARGRHEALVTSTAAAGQLLLQQAHPQDAVLGTAAGVWAQRHQLAQGIVRPGSPAALLERCAQYGAQSLISYHSCHMCSLLPGVVTIRVDKTGIVVWCVWTAAKMPSQQRALCDMGWNHANALTITPRRYHTA